MDGRGRDEDGRCRGMWMVEVEMRMVEVGIRRVMVEMRIVCNQDIRKNHQPRISSTKIK